MQAEQAKRLTQLEKENCRLKKLLAKADLGQAMLKEFAKGNCRACALSQSRYGPAGSFSGFGALCRPGGGAAPQYPAPWKQGPRPGRDQAQDCHRKIAAEHIRWGRPTACRLLRREGWTVNHKREHRLWREEGLQRHTPRKRKLALPADGSVRHHRAEHPHQVWAMEFQFEATADGRRLKFPNVFDEQSRLSARPSESAGAARPRTWWPCWRSSPASTRRQRLFNRTTGRSSLPRPYGTGERPATPQAPPTSSRDPHGRTDSRNRSMVSSVMSSSLPSCSPRLLERRSWLIAVAGSTTYSGHTRLSRGVRPWLPHDHNHLSHKASTDNEVHVTDASCKFEHWRWRASSLNDLLSKQS